MTTLAALAASIAQRVPNVPTNFTDTEREAAAAESIGFFSSHFKINQVSDIAGSGVFDLTLPAAFDQDCSLISSVEYPAGERVPKMLQSDTYTVYDDGGGTKVLRLLCDTPSADETVRITYSVDYDVTSLPTKEENAVINLACSYYCDWIAAAYSSSTRSTIGTDSAEHLQQERSFHDSARRFRDLAFEYWGFDSTAGGDGRARGSGNNGSGGGATGGPTSPSSDMLSWYPTSAGRSHRLTHQ